MGAIVAGMVLVFVGLLGSALILGDAGIAHLSPPARGRAVIILGASVTLLCSGVALLVGGG